MEEVVAALEEDVRELGEESLEVATDDLLFLLVDEHKYDFTRAEGIGPVLHFESILDLSLAQLEKILLALRIVEFDGIGDLAIGEGLRVLLSLDELLEVTVEGLGEATVLTLAVELVAELEELSSHEIVQVQKLGILAERVEDDLRDRGVEVDARDEAVLINDFLKLTVGKE